MKDFFELFKELDSTNKKLRHKKSLTSYFSDHLGDESKEKDAAWALFFLLGEKLRRIFKSSELREVASGYSKLPLWLVEECYDTVGDLADTISLLSSQVKPSPAPSFKNYQLSELIEDKVIPISKLPSVEKKKVALVALLKALPGQYHFLLLKFFTGGLRVGVSKQTIVSVIADITEISESTISRRLLGEFKPSATSLRSLFAEEGELESTLQPYPFFLAHPLEAELPGEPSDWFAEWKWDGIRAQALKQGEEILLWSRGDEVINQQFPEVCDALMRLDCNVTLDAELLAWENGKALPFQALQKRLGRKNVSSSIIKKYPCALKVYDILEIEGEELREYPLSRRKELLSALRLESFSGKLLTSEVLEFKSKIELRTLREGARENGTEGLMLKRKDSPYLVGRKRGYWWKWKVEPLTVDAVLIYAQKGHGRRSGLFTDYTFALWNKEKKLLPVGKAYSGLTDAEFLELDKFIKKNTIERFGPVRSVNPEVVIELAFDSVSRSTRHKSGYSLRFPRMKRIRYDKKVSEADTLEILAGMTD